MRTFAPVRSGNWCRDAAGIIARNNNESWSHHTGFYFPFPFLYRIESAFINVCNTATSSTRSLDERTRESNCAIRNHQYVEITIVSDVIYICVYHIQMHIARIAGVLSRSGVVFWRFVFTDNPHNRITTTRSRLRHLMSRACDAHSKSQTCICIVILVERNALAASFVCQVSCAPFARLVRVCFRNAFIAFAPSSRGCGSVLCVRWLARARAARNLHPKITV